MDFIVSVEITVDAASIGDAVDNVESLFDADDGLRWAVLGVQEP